MRKLIKIVNTYKIIYVFVTKKKQNGELNTNKIELYNLILIKTEIYFLLLYFYVYLSYDSIFLIMIFFF